MIQALQQFVEQHPGWNWLAIGASWFVSLLQPIALAVTIVLGLLQIYVIAKKEGWIKGKDRAGDQ